MALTAIYPFRVRSYAAAIFLDGTQRFTARDGYTGIPADYVLPVKQHAASTYTVAPYALPENPLVQIAEALAKGYITQQEYDDTVALV